MGSQDQSPACAVSYQCRYSPYVCHSSPCRSAAAAAIGPSTNSTLSINPSRGAITTSGNPVVIHCACRSSNGRERAEGGASAAVGLLPHRRERRVCHDVSSPADHVSNGMTMQNTSSGAHTGFVDGGAQI